MERMTDALRRRVYREKPTVDGVKLTNARLKAELSLREVVERLADGCNKSSVSRWEQGKLNPSTERIEKLAVLYGTRDFIIKTNA